MAGKKKKKSESVTNSDVNLSQDLADDSEKTSAKVSAIKAGMILKFGDDLVKTLDSRPKLFTEGISWGCPSINLACTGHPLIGLIFGRIYEIFGPNSSGKTTLLLTAIAECQANGGVAAFVDAEHALDPSYAKNLGVRMVDLLLTQPDSGEQGLEVVEEYVKAGVNLVGVDSVAALTPQAEIDGNYGDSNMGVHARLMSQAMRKLTAIIGKKKCAVVFLNQVRNKIGVIFGSPEVVPGGDALKFYSSLRMRAFISTAKDKRILGDTKNSLGSSMSIEVIKNKIYPPFKKAEVKIYYGCGFDRIQDLFNVAVAWDLIKKKRAKKDKKDSDAETPGDEADIPGTKAVYILPDGSQVGADLEGALKVEKLLMDAYQRKIKS